MSESKKNGQKTTQLCKNSEFCHKFDKTNFMCADNNYSSLCKYFKHTKTDWNKKFTVKRQKLI